MTRLIADIGGTSLRLAHQNGDDPTLCDPAIMACADFATAEDAFAGYCAKHRLDIDMLCLAVAGPVNGGKVDITNNHWQFDVGKLAAAMNLRAYLLINDFTAQAMAHRDLLQNNRSMPFREQKAWLWPRLFYWGSPSRPEPQPAIFQRRSSPKSPPSGHQDPHPTPLWCLRSHKMCASL